MMNRLQHLLHNQPPSTFALMHESVLDAVDGSSTGTCLTKMWALLDTPTNREEPRMQAVSTIGPDPQCPMSVT
jgi:hypothetical protein